MGLLRPEATVLSLGRRVLSFDREGRPYHYFREGKTYKRALDGSLHLRYREGERRRRRLAPEEALGVYREVLDLAEAHLRDVRRREEVLRWTPEGLLDPTPYRRAYASEIAFEAANQAIQIHGDYGYVREFPVEKLLRDVKLNQIYEGTNEIQRLIIARHILAE